MDDLFEIPGKVIYKWTLEDTNTGPVVPASGFGSADSKSGGLVRMAWSLTRSATSTPPSTKASSSTE